MIEKIKSVAIILLICMCSYDTYLLTTLSKSLDSKVVTLTDKIESVSINTNGKLQDLTDKYNSSSNDNIAATVNSINTTEEDITYTQKTSSSDADVEIRKQPSTVKVKVNDGSIYSFKTLETEKTKFEDGKLTITSAATSNINITTDEYEQSKWRLITAINADKKVMGGIGYALGHCIEADVFIGQGMKPFYGITWMIGSHNKKQSKVVD